MTTFKNCRKFLQADSDEFVTKQWVADQGSRPKETKITETLSGWVMALQRVPVGFTKIMHLRSSTLRRESIIWD